MGSVISSIECPHCHYEEAYEDYYYKIDVAYIFCQRCGCYNEWENIDDESPDADVYEKLRGGHGCLSVYFDGIGSLTGFDTDEETEKFKETFNREEWKTNKGNPCTAATLTYLKGDKWMLLDLFDKTEVEFDSVEREKP